MSISSPLQAYADPTLYSLRPPMSISKDFHQPITYPYHDSYSSNHPISNTTIFLIYPHEYHILQCIQYLYAYKLHSTLYHRWLYIQTHYHSIHTQIQQSLPIHFYQNVLLPELHPHKLNNKMIIWFNELFANETSILRI